MEFFTNTITNFLTQLEYLSLIFLMKKYCRGWQDDPAISTIDRVKLSELDFPAITVCPDWATDELAVQTVYNM